MSEPRTQDRQHPRRYAWMAAGAWTICIATLLSAVVAGVRLHGSLWESTQPIRFYGDISNAYQQGRRAEQAGILDVYDQVASKAYKRSDGVREFGLDYPPLRLTAAWLWYRWTHDRFPEVTQWQNTWEFNRPLLMMNRGLLLLATLSVFGIVLTVRRWAVDGNSSAFGRLAPLILATVGALLCWFNPPANLIAFGWPQWDVCVPAFFLAAMLAALHRWWLLAGVLLATGGLFKGQLFVILPVMVLWPALAGDFAGLLRLCIGIVAAIGAVAFPFWFHGAGTTIRPEAIWLFVALVGAWVIGRICRYLPECFRRWRAVPLLTSVIYCALFGWVAAWYAGAVISALVGGLLFVLAWQLRWRSQPALLALAAAVAAWVPAIFTSTSWAWLQVGLLYGSEHFNQMHMGLPSNLPAILRASFDVHSPDMIALSLPGDIAVSWKQLLRGAFITGSILCAIALAVHYRRRSPWVVLPAATSWMLFVTFPAQIHERYIMYAALVSAPLVALGFRWTVLHLALCLIAIPPVLQGMFASGNPAIFMVSEFGPTFGPSLARTVAATFPGIGWALVCLTLISLWRSMDLRTVRQDKETALPRMPEHP